MLKYNIQIGANWYKDIMTEGTDTKGVKWIDYLGWRGNGNVGWGCVVTSLANIQQEYSGKEFTPKKLNKILKENKGYYWLSGKTKMESNASYIDWQVPMKLFGFSISRVQPKDYIRNKNIYYIARIENKYGGHYVNVIKRLAKRFICFDVLNGSVALIKENKITFLTEIIFRS